MQARERANGWLVCPGCDQSTTKIFTLLRPPKAPEEKRICINCVDALQKAGWEVLRTFRPLPGGQPHQFSCWECHSLDDLTFRIVSLTGDPVELERCEGCADELKKDGWRKATVHGTF